MSNSQRQYSAEPPVLESQPFDGEQPAFYVTQFAHILAEILRKSRKQGPINSILISKLSQYAGYGTVIFDRPCSLAGGRIMIRRRRLTTQQRRLNRAPNRRSAWSATKRKIRQRRHVQFSMLHAS